MKALLFVLIALSAFTGEAHAADRELVKAFSQYVVELNRPIYVYNWFNANGRSPQWKTQLAPNDLIGFDHATDLAGTHFQGLCTGDASVDAPDCSAMTTSFGRDNMFGYGLYASVDPVATASYGGGSDWVLLQMRMQKNFRLLSLVWRVQNDSFNQAASQQLADMQCGYYPEQSISTVLTAMLQYEYTGGASGSPTDKHCAASIRKLLKDELKLDGFYYPYSGSTIKDCENTLANSGGPGFDFSGNAIRQGAFVIMSTAHMKASDVTVFNSKSTGDLADRLRIATTFYKADVPVDWPKPSPAALGSLAYYKANGLPNQPGYTVSRWVANGCYSLPTYQCGDWFQICNASLPSNNCSYTVLPLVDGQTVAIAPPGTTITAASFPAAMAPAQALIWPDLEGKTQDPAISSWIKSNFLGCSDLAPYARVPNLRFGRWPAQPANSGQ